ncbi:acyltransferase [Arthrobacter sp. AL12]|uniref:acyltransferase family protein n=1 Tax=Arthrobacter sp. AL12 TaxID=3042241 RepID=UPI00249A7D11|nr:acyltransferase [Arthrobacter sp. AL12]MDI3213825.1 acyltransferase [Arthrobacter sp. AL12]
MATSTLKKRSSMAVGLKKPNLRRDIQGLRALAVLAVIADHLFHWPTGGFVGVDVFFVISGFLITGLLLREHEKTGTISFRSFYERRIKRIMPAALLVLVVTMAASYFLIGRGRIMDTLWDSVWALFFAANWRFAAQGTDYFQEGLPPSPVQHFWSLAVEEQFYVVWPWLMLGILALGVRRFGWGPGQRRAAVAVAIAIITVLSFAWAMYETLENPTVAYFSTASRAWELGIGALIAVVQRGLHFRHAAVRTSLGWVGFLGILYSLFVVPASAGFPAPWALLPVLATALVIVAGVGGDQARLWPLTNRGSAYVGEISYSLYLWHFPVLVLLVAVLPTDNVLYYLAALILTAACASASYHWLEKPARKAQWFPAKNRPLPTDSRLGWQYVGLGALTLAAVVAVGAALTPVKCARQVSETVSSLFFGYAARGS